MAIYDKSYLDKLINFILRPAIILQNRSIFLKLSKNVIFTCSKVETITDNGIMSDDLFSKGKLDTARLSELLKGIQLPDPATIGTGGFDKISFGSSGFGFDDHKTPEQYLLDDVKRQDPSVSVVSMNEAKTVAIAADQKHTLFTFGLGGCTAALVISQRPDGSSVATMTHYDHLHRQIHPLIIQREAMQHHKDLPEGTTHSVMIVSPGDYIKIGEKWERKIKDEDIVNLLIDAAKRVLGDSKIEVKLCPYSESMEIGKSSGFIVRFNPKGTEPVRYETHGEYFGSLPLKPSA